MKLHPLTSLAIAGSAAVVTTAAASVPLSLAVMATAAALSFLSGRGAQVLAASAMILVPLCLALFMVHGLFFPEGTTVIAQWGPARVTIEGLTFAAERASRIGAAVVPLLVFSCTVSVPDLVAALSARGVSGRVAFVLAATLALVPAVGQQQLRIRQAQEARGLVIRRHLPSRIAAFRLQALPLVLSLVEEASGRAQALEARGFVSAARPTSYRQVQDPLPQRILRWLVLLCAAVVVGLRLSSSLPGGNW